VLPTKRSTSLLVLLGASFFFFAVIEQFIRKQDLVALAVVHGVVISMLCYAWCRAEAIERGSLTPGRSALWAGLLPILGIPIYLFRTRGMKRGLISAIKALLLLTALGICSEVVGSAVNAIRT